MNVKNFKFNIKSRLMDILKERNMTQMELSEISGVTQGSISRFANNSRYEIEHLIRISRALNLQIEDLFEIEIIE